MNINLKKIVIIAVVELAIILSTVAVTDSICSKNKGKTKEAIPTPKEILTTNTFSDQKKLEPGKNYMLKYSMLKDTIEYGSGETSREIDFIIYFTYKDQKQLEEKVYPAIVDKMLAEYGRDRLLRDYLHAKKKQEFTEIKIIK